MSGPQRKSSPIVPRQVASGRKPRCERRIKPDLRKLEIPTMLVRRKTRSNVTRAHRPWPRFLLIMLLLLTFGLNINGQFPVAKEANQVQLHGGIEISPEGI